MDSAEALGCCKMRLLGIEQLVDKLKQLFTRGGSPIGALRAYQVGHG
jgi:hypothetical protein